MSKISSASNNGIGFVGILTVVFITLKIIGQISWSWWWVLSPMWIPFLLVISILLCIGIGCLIYFGYKKYKKVKWIMLKIKKEKYDYYNNTSTTIKKTSGMGPTWVSTPIEKLSPIVTICYILTENSIVGRGVSVC